MFSRRLPNWVKPISFMFAVPYGVSYTKGCAVAKFGKKHSRRRIRREYAKMKALSK